MEKAQAQQAEEAKGEYEKAKGEIAAATQKEMEAAMGYKAIVAKKMDVFKKVEECRKELYEAQKKVAMLEVLAVNHAKMKALEENRRAAQAAAEDARKNMLEQKQREKDALEATRKALAEVREAQKASRRPAAKDIAPAAAAGATAPADID